MVTGAGKKITPTAHPTLLLSHTHVHTSTHIYYIFSPPFSHPEAPDVTSGTMNLTYRSGDSYLAAAKVSGDVRTKSNMMVCRLMAALDQRP